MAPSVVALSLAARERMTALAVSSAKDGVTIQKASGHWAMAYAPRCPVAEARVEAALDSLAKLTALPSPQRIESGADFTRRIIVYAGKERLLKLAIGPRTKPGGDGVLVQLDDGTTLELKHYRPELFPAEPEAWCREK